MYQEVERYKQVVYQEVERYSGDSRTQLVTETEAVEELYPGRNYSISVAAISNSVESDPASQIYVATSKLSRVGMTGSYTWIVRFV